MTEKILVQRLPPIGSPQAKTFSPRSNKKYDGLTGPHYTLGGKGQHYTLPPPTFLKPYQDTKAGGLETWPAHATGHAGSSTSMVFSKDKQLVVYEEEDKAAKMQTVPKPRFLDQLESFLKKELQALGACDVGPSDLRLQAYREVFEYLIEDFKTYKPLLSAIKNEYEMMLAHQREQIRQLEPLKQMLVTVSEHCDQKIMSLREEEKQDMVDLRDENKKLYARIDQLRQEKQDLDTQVEHLQEELAAEYLRYRNECDARKLLVSDINELRYQQEDMVMAKQSMEELEEQKEDPVTLKIALKKAREDESAATKRLNEMVANYGDVIPRRDFEMLQKQYEELEESLDEHKDDFQKLKDEHDTLLGTYKQVLQERDDYYYEYENLRNKALTPRPDWDKCADHVAGGIMRWKELSEGKKSDELVDIVLSELAGGGAGAEAIGAEYFDGQGEGPEVPVYLCYEGQVRNRRLGKRDTALLIKDIWREKTTQDAERGDGTYEKMATFVHEYLKRRFGLDQMVVEWGYNLHDACQRFAHDDRIGLFWNILTDEGDEELYHMPLQMIAKLLNHLTKLDVERGNQGEIAKDDFKQSLQEFFSCKDYFFQGMQEENLLTLIREAETELDARGADTLQYTNLFVEDDEGKTGPFLEEFKKHLKQERQKYVETIKESLADTSVVSKGELEKAITICDTYIKRADLDKYLAWAFRKTSKDQLDDTEPVELSALILRLLNGNLRKHSQYEN